MSGDYTLEDSIFILFTTRAFATGIPGTLSASTVAVYEDVTATPIETGIGVTESLNSIAGLNAVTIAALAASGYNAGGHYHIVIEAGAVDSVSVAGEVVGHFTIAVSAAAVDLANATDGLTALKVLIDAIPTTAMRGTDNANTTVPDVAGTAPTVSEITSDINSNLDKTGFALSTAGILAIWHQALTEVVTAGSVGKLLKDEITAVRMAVLTDWIDAGRLDLILDELTVQGNTNETKIDAVPTAIEIQAEMEENGASLLDTIRDELANGTDGLSALKVLIDTINTDLSNGTDGLGALKTLVDTVNTDLGNGTDGLGALKTLIDALPSSAAILTTALTESYAADGSTATLSQLLYMIWSFLNSLKFVGTTGTSRKLDGTTTAMTFTLDDADNPTDKNRTT